MAAVYSQNHVLHNLRQHHQQHLHHNHHQQQQQQQQQSQQQSQQQQSQQQQQQQQQQQPIQHHRKHSPKHRFLAEFSQCLYDFVIQLLPTPEELAIKEDVRKLLERLIRTLEPDSRLLSFGSTANGFSLRNSDMDLCCLIDSEDRLSASDLVTMLGDLLERETKFHVKPLPLARIPIVKLSLDPSPGLPFGIACDIGFENRLALENTRLLMCYAMIDPARVRTMVLFLKVWCKRRKINSPYKGTLSSYGYVLLVIFFLVHVKNPPVLPNLQQMPPLRPISKEESHINGHNIWFFDDINLLRQRWRSSNNESVAELLVDFFRYFSREFPYNSGVVSIRAGILKKESKGWLSEAERGSARERNRLCIEDPFEVDYNVARCVTRDGLYTIRGELMRASRILASRPDRPVVALAQLCEERKDEELLQASPSRPSFPPPRMSLPPQTPYTVGSNPMRAVPDRLSPPQVHEAPASLQQQQDTIGLPPDQLDHMAPKRAKWTSPPPPEAPDADHSDFEDKLGESLALAMAATNVRAKDKDKDAETSSAGSGAVTDDDDHRSDMAESVDDVRSTRSYTEDGVYFTRHHGQPTLLPGVQAAPASVQDPSSSKSAAYLVQAAEALIADPRVSSRLRGRPHRLGQPVADAYQASPKQHQNLNNAAFVPVVAPRLDQTRRSLSGPPRSHRYSLPLPGAAHVPAGVYPPRGQGVVPPRSNVFYETSPMRDRFSRAAAQAAPVLTTYCAPATYTQDVTGVASSSGDGDKEPHQATASPKSYSPSPHTLSPDLAGLGRDDRVAGNPHQQQHHCHQDVPSASTTPSPNDSSYPHTRLHSHSHSAATIIAPATPLPNSGVHFTHLNGRTSGVDGTTSPSSSPARSTSRSPSQSRDVSSLMSHDYHHRAGSPFASMSSESGSPAMSFTSSHYAASVSPLSTSPPSPTASDTMSKHLAPTIPEENEGPPIPSISSKDDLPPGSPVIAVVNPAEDDELVKSTETLTIDT